MGYNRLAKNHGEESPGGPSPPPGPGILPADPWRRWGAAVLDTFLLWMGHLLLWLGSLLILPVGEWQLSFLPVWGGFGGLAYLVLFWKMRGATPGQEAFGLQVVRYDGQPLTWKEALRRLGGYLLAALPFHLGFLSIFWDPYRRGWHDFIAQTLVIRRRPGPLPLPPPAAVVSPGPEESRPPVAWPRWGIVALLYLGLALGWTYPLLRHFSTHIAGKAEDGFHFIWSFWHAHQALLKGQESLLTTNLLFFPRQTSLLYYSACWIYALPAALMLRWLTLTQTFNFFFLLSLASSGFLACLLAWTLGCGLVEAFLAGLLFGFSPYLMAHGASGHLELIATEFLVLFALLSYQALTRSSAWRILAAGVALAMVGYGSWYYLVSACLLLPCLAVGIAAGPACDAKASLARQVRSWARLGGRAVLVGLAGALLLSPLLGPMLRERQRTHAMDIPLSVSTLYSTDLAFVAFSNPLHPVWGEWVAEHLYRGAEQVTGLGFIALGLGGIALFKRWRKLLPWGLTGAFFLVLAFGPLLQMAHWEVQLPSWLLLLAGGPPGNGLGWPFRADLSLDCGRSFIAAPDLFWKRTCSFPLPFAWLRHVFPPLRPLRAPGRFALVTSLCGAVLAAWGLRLARGNARRRWGKRGEWAVVALVFAGVLWESLPLPYPITSTSVSPFYHQLAREPRPAVLLEVPVYGLCQYNFYQTLHGQPLFFGFHSREPWEALAFRDRNRLLAILTYPAGGYRGKRPLVIDLAGTETLPLSRLRRQFRPSVRELVSLGGRYVIVHKPWLRQATLRRIDRLLGEALALPICWEDQELRVYRLQASEQRTPLSRSGTRTSAAVPAVAGGRLAFGRCLPNGPPRSG